MIFFLAGLLIGFFLGTISALKMLINGELKYDIIKTDRVRLTNYHGGNRYQSPH